MCAGMYAGRAMLKTVVLERGFPGGELLNTELVEDYPGFESVLGHELAQKFHTHAAKFGAEFKDGATGETVKRLDNGWFAAAPDNGDRYTAASVIITPLGRPVKHSIHVGSRYAGTGAA